MPRREPVCVRVSRASLLVRLRPRGVSHLCDSRTPCFKFWSRLVANAACAVLITMLTIGYSGEPGTDEARISEIYHYSMLLWALAGFLSELQQFAPSWKLLKAELVSLTSPSLSWRVSG